MSKTTTVDLLPLASIEQREVVGGQATHRFSTQRDLDGDADRENLDPFDCLGLALGLFLGHGGTAHHHYEDTADRSPALEHSGPPSARRREVSPLNCTSGRSSEQTRIEQMVTRGKFVGQW